MRMRKKKHGAERIEACSHLLITPNEAFKADPQSAFTEKKPIHLEIGCGKGNFAVGMAAQHHDVNFIAMEKIADVACLALGLFALTRLLSPFAEDETAIAEEAGAEHEVTTDSEPQESESTDATE